MFPLASPSAAARQATAFPLASPSAAACQATAFPLASPSAAARQATAFPLASPSASAPKPLRGLRGEDDLAELLALGQPLLRGHAVLERHHRVHDGLEPAPEELA